jgi:hypothetical protein
LGRQRNHHFGHRSHTWLLQVHARRPSRTPHTRRGQSQNGTLTRKPNCFGARLLFVRQWKMYVLPRFKHKSFLRGSYEANLQTHRLGLLDADVFW